MGVHLDIAAAHHPTQQRRGGAGTGAVGDNEPWPVAACAETTLSKKVALIIPSIPASQPSMIIASMGSMITF